jgi:hypothetical protein
MLHPECSRNGTTRVRPTARRVVPRIRSSYGGVKMAARSAGLRWTSDVLVRADLQSCVHRFDSGHCLRGNADERHRGMGCGVEQRHIDWHRLRAQQLRAQAFELTRRTERSIERSRELLDQTSRLIRTSRGTGTPDMRDGDEPADMGPSHEGSES